jgi:hypothetical protein
VNRLAAAGLVTILVVALAAACAAIAHAVLDPALTATRTGVSVARAS